MSQAARPLRAAPTPAPRPRLRAVPPARGPSPAVIRRRRLVALAGLGGLIALPLAFLALAGGSSDAARIEALLSAGAQRPAGLCDHLSGAMLRAVGGHDACVAASPTRGPAGEVSAIRVSGARASAVVTRADGDERIRLVREDGDWKVDDVR